MHFDFALADLWMFVGRKKGYKTIKGKEICFGFALLEWNRFVFQYRHNYKQSSFFNINIICLWVNCVINRAATRTSWIG